MNEIKKKKLDKLKEEADKDVYTKAYNGVDMITVISTKKDIKGHIYNKIKGESNEAQKPKSDE